ncbi:MAG: metallophosphoesterase [Erysipelotrichaceae bacterium]
MLALAFAIPAYILLIFIFYKQVKYINKYFKGNKIMIALSAIYLLISPLSIPGAFFSPRGTLLRRVLTSIGNYWMGFNLHFVLAMGLCFLIRLIVKLIKKDKYNLRLAQKITNVVVVSFTILMSVYGIVNAQNLQVTTYDVTVDKASKQDELNVVLIADLHLGYSVGVRQMERMVNKINELEPDVVVVAGDIFDNEFSAIANPVKVAEVLRGINSKYGVYAVYGNHDIEEDILCGFTFSDDDVTQVTSIKEMDDFIENCGFTFLYDEAVLINDDFYIYGRPDEERPNFGNDSRIEASKITEGLDQSKLILCVDHEPAEQKELSAAGVDVDLNGHTHAGQVFPGNIIINFFWDIAYGYKNFDGMHNIVTSGVGLFGPNMRTFTKAEIAQVMIHLN